MTLRDYDAARDKEAVHRIWREVGWGESGKEDVFDGYVESSRGHVGELHGEAECLVITSPGTIRYQEEDLRASFVTGVTTSRVARKQGLAARLTARAIAADAAEGTQVMALSMFEQGFYNLLGFGTGSYEHILAFDPSQLQIPVRARPPRRVTLDHWKEAHAARMARQRTHGACCLTSDILSRAEMKGYRNGFGLGYFDGPNGELTHMFWAGADDVEHGPYRVGWLVYRNREQFWEMMAVLKSLGDQVSLVKMNEPSGMQIQDLLRQPFKFNRITDKSRFDTGATCLAYYQFRICDLSGCLEKTHLRGDTLRFNLTLNDPVEKHLEPKAAWRGIGGEYVVTLGPESHAKPGQSASLPTLAASAGAFARLWLGVLPATGLSISDELDGPPELLRALDDTLRLPSPHPDWEF